jgi:hypothetical protein
MGQEYRAQNQVVNVTYQLFDDKERRIPMTSVVGSATGPTGKTKNCDTWAEYEPPMSSSFANLCNGGSFEGYRWQACPSRLECRNATQNSSRVQVLATNRSGFAQTTAPTRKEAPASPQVVPGQGHPHMDTPKLSTQGAYRPSPTFLPQENESLFGRFFRNVVQAIIHAVFHQGKEMTENTDLFPNKRPAGPQE